MVGEDALDQPACGRLHPVRQRHQPRVDIYHFSDRGKTSMKAGSWLTLAQAVGRARARPKTGAGIETSVHWPADALVASL
jgi:hypothetical protein